MSFGVSTSPAKSLKGGGTNRVMNLNWLVGYWHDEMTSDALA